MLRLNFDEFPNLESARLTLRALVIEDAPEVHFLRSNFLVNQFLNRKPSNSVEDAISFIQDRIADFKGKVSIYWAIAFNDNPSLIGTICLWKLSQVRKSAEIGYELHPDFQGRGIAKEAVQSVLKFAFNEIGLEKVYGMTLPENIASIHVLESCGFQQDFDYVLNNEELKENLMVFTRSKAVFNDSKKS